MSGNHLMHAIEAAMGSSRQSAGTAVEAAQQSVRDSPLTLLLPFSTGLPLGASQAIAVGGLDQ
jgi:hypothetical protein